MKKVVIIGAGTGKDTLTQEGLRAIEEADLLMGAETVLLPYRGSGRRMHTGYTAAEVQSALEGGDTENIAVLVSGDPGFYSAARKLRESLQDCRIETLPGISSLNAFYAKCQRSWQDDCLLSCHGREANVADAVRRNAATFLLADDEIAEVLHSLTEAGFGDLKVTIGEALGSTEERIFTSKIGEVTEPATGIPRVLRIENPKADARIRFGIPDGEFVRGSVPMTKSEVRAVTAGLLHLAPDAVACDIGAGTGSVTAEMAMAAYKGRIYAIERLEEGAALIRENANRFHLGNIRILTDTAARALTTLPKLDAAFVGGSGGELPEIMKALYENNPDMTVVVTAITPETVTEALAEFAKWGKEANLTEIGVTRSQKAGKKHLMKANNPVTIISVEGGTACAEG